MYQHDWTIWEYKASCRHINLVHAYLLQVWLLPIEFLCFLIDHVLENLPRWSIVREVLCAILRGAILQVNAEVLKHNAWNVP